MARYSIREATMVDQLDRLEKDMQSMKSLQYVGRGVLTTKLSEPTPKILSSDGFDFSIPPVLSYQAVSGKITFTADKQLNPYARLVVENFDLSGNQYSLDGFNSATDPGLDTYEFVVGHVDDGMMEWRVIVSRFATPTVRFYTRFRVAATDSGTVSYIDYQDDV